MPQPRTPRHASIRPSLRASLLALGLALAACGDGSDGAAPGASLEGTYALVEENGRPLPSDPQGGTGCCITLDGSLVLAPGTYVLRTTYRNKDRPDAIRNTEEGTWRADGRLLRFTRTRGSDANVPYLLGAGSATPDGRTVVLPYGDEGPGSDQIRATFRRP